MPFLVPSIPHTFHTIPPGSTHSFLAVTSSRTLPWHFVRYKSFTWKLVHFSYQLLHDNAPSALVFIDLIEMLC